MRSLRPTWLTAAVIALPVALFGLAALVGWDFGVFTLLYLLIDVPFEPYRRLGLPVGRRGDWFGFAVPNALGWTLIAATDLLVLYLISALVSAAWRRRRA
jgi:hypothetical protein